LFRTVTKVARFRLFAVVDGNQICTLRGMAVSSLMVPLGTPAPYFTLDDISGATVHLNDFATAPALLVAFLCNHCPYVRHIESELGRTVARYPSLAVVGICTNDAEAYPDDRPERLADQARRASWTFPYLVDTDQTVGRAFAAVCTPDFFLYDAQRRLAYRGAFDESTPGNGKPVTGVLLRDAISRVLAGEPVPEPHRPSMGCSIKWRS
jgi:peroxiredoxin